MKLSKTILGALLGVLAVTATANAQIGFIVRGGYQGANMKGYSIDTKMVNGARAGVALDLTVYNGGMSRISIQPGVDFAMKGFKVGEVKDDDLAAASSTNTLYYVDIPLLANFSFDLGNSFGVFVNAGPYLGIGVGGNMNLNAKIFGIEGKGERELNAFGDDGLYKRLDWGAQVGAGVEFNRFQLGIGTQFGFGDLRNSNIKLESTKDLTSSNFFVTVGYRF